MHACRQLKGMDAGRAGHARAMQAGYSQAWPCVWPHMRPQNACMQLRGMDAGHARAMQAGYGSAWPCVWPHTRPQNACMQAAQGDGCRLSRPCQRHAGRLQLGLALRLASHEASEGVRAAQGGWMQAMPGPCRQATARLGLAFGLTRPQNACMQLRGGGCKPSRPCQRHAGRLQLGLALRLASQGLRMHACSSGGVDAGRAGHARAMQAGYS